MDDRENLSTVTFFFFCPAGLSLVFISLKQEEPIETTVVYHKVTCSDTGVHVTLETLLHI